MLMIVYDLTCLTLKMCSRPKVFGSDIHVIALKFIDDTTLEVLILCRTSSSVIYNRSMYLKTYSNTIVAFKVL